MSNLYRYCCMKFIFCSTRYRSIRNIIIIAVVLLNFIFLFSLLRNRDASQLKFSRQYGESSGGNGRVKRNGEQPVTPLRGLRELATVRIGANVNNKYLTPTVNCIDFKGEIPSKKLKETYKWQIVVNGLRESFVFSAYYDARTSPPMLRIIGVSGGYYTQPEKPIKFCQLWYSGSHVPRAVQAEYIIVPETHGRSYAAAFHQCFLEPDRGIPFAVSLVGDQCDLPNNVLKVIVNDDEAEPEVEFAVCVTPFNFAYDNVHQLVEMIEFNRLFGARRFTFYNYSTGANVEKYLRNAYGTADDITVIPWHVPLAVDVWPPDPKVEPEIHYFGQLTAINDCLYRNMYSARFIVFTDLDELLVPTYHNTWTDMLDNATKSWQTQLHADGHKIFPGAYLVQNVFFRIDFKNDARFSSNSLVVNDLRLMTLLKTDREQEISMFYVRSKYIVWSRMVVMVSVHSVLDFIDNSRLMHARVTEDHVLLHHYRIPLQEKGEAPPKTVRDRSMHRFADEAIFETKARHIRAGAILN